MAAATNRHLRTASIKMGLLMLLLYFMLEVNCASYGIGFISRKAALAISPNVMLIQNEDGTYTFTMFTSFRSVDCTFRLGEEFIEERADGVKVKSIFTLEGNKLIQIQIEDNGMKSIHVREFIDDILIVTSTAEGWEGKSVRTYELIK